MKRRAAKLKKASLRKKGQSAEKPQELKPQTDVESKEVIASAAEGIERNTNEPARNYEVVLSPPPLSSDQKSGKSTVNKVPEDISYSETELSGENGKPCEPECFPSAEYVPMAADHKKPDVGFSEVLAPQINDESHLLKTNICDTDPTNDTDLNAETESLPETALPRHELDNTLSLLLMIKARHDNLKQSLDAAMHSVDELSVAVTKLLEKKG